ncbi:MAG: lactonase family protein [Gorillibacterium sp.]|nr:lactonase family protein [Gorillibacterium sp.]
MTHLTPYKLLFIGSYADTSEPGVYICQYHELTGELQLLDMVSGLRNPTFLDVDAEAERLYVLMEEQDAAGKRYGAVAAFEINLCSGTLVLLNKIATLPSPTCHLTLDKARRFLITASYHGGMVGLSPILADGRIGETLDSHQHVGSSLLPAQCQARCHSATLDASNQFAIVCDLGLDKIISYQLDSQSGRLVPRSEAKLNPGSGPRHFVFHPYLPFAYVINELNSTITGFTYAEETGELTEIQTISTLPATYSEDNACADIHISPDGRYLYGSNRGHDSLAVYAVDSTAGTLTIVEYAPTLGGHPRNFALSRDGRFVWVANRDSNHVVTFSRDAETGKLLPTGYELSIAKPVCIRFM